MYSVGILHTNNRNYTVYEIQEKGFYRLDICKEGAQFHVDPTGVVYSEYTKRLTRTYGDVKLKDRIKEIKRKVKFANLREQTTSGWEDGAFIERIVTESVNGLSGRTEIKNGEPIIEEYGDNGDYFIMKVIEGYNTAIREPINPANYVNAGTKLEDLAVQNAVGAAPFIPLAELRKRLNLRHLDDKDYSYIHSEAEGRAYLLRCKKAAEETLEKLKQNGGVFTEEMGVGYDIESTGLGMDLYGEDKLVGVILSAYPNESRYFGFRHNFTYNLPISFLDELFDTLIEIQEIVMAHNGKFDRKGATRQGKDLRIGHDSYILALLVNPVMKKGVHGLKHLEYERSHNRYLEFDDIFPDKSNINFADLPEDLIVAYACPDADNTRRVWHDQWKKLPKAERFIYDIERHLASLKSDQEYWGFRVDVNDLIEGQANCIEVIDMLKKYIFILAKRSDINIDSPEVIADLIYNKMRCPILMTTDSGKPSTSSKALEKLSKIKLKEPKDIIKQNIKDSKGNTIIKASDLNEAQYPLMLFLVEYRKYIKLNTAFYNRIVKGAVASTTYGENACARYFSWINQIVSSGRQSSPLHQFPKAIKRDILADTPEHYLVDSDFSQIELRMIFSLAKETALILKASNPSIDIHRAIQYVISHTPIWQISKEQRQKGKSRNFGVVYMISGRGLANNMFGAGATPKQIKDCEQSIAEFYKAFKRIKKFVAKNKAMIETKGYMRTMFYRYKYFYEILDPEVSKERKASLIRQGNNLPVQGSAADLMKMAENNIQDYIRKKGWDKLVETSVGKYPLVRCMLSIHDEPLVSAHRSIPVEEILEMIAICMELPIGNYFYRTPIEFSNEEVESIQSMKLEPCELDEDIYQNVLAKNSTHYNRQPFAPLFAASSISDNWEEGHGGDYELQRELRTRLLHNYHATGKSAFDPWHKSEVTVKKKDEAGNEIEVKEMVYDLKDQIIKAIGAFADESLDTYMEGLIAKYGEDPDVVKDHVQDDVLTHELVGSAKYKPSKADIAQHGKYSHMELIEYATRKYMELRSAKLAGVTPISEARQNKNDEKEKDEDIKETFMEIAGLSDELVNVTPEGDYIYESEDEEDVTTDAGIFTYDDEYESIMQTASPCNQYCYELADIVLLDLTEIKTKANVNRILNYIFEQSKADGFYPVKIAYAGRELDTGMRLEDVDQEAIDKYIQTIIDSEMSEAV